MLKVEIVGAGLEELSKVVFVLKVEIVGAGLGGADKRGRLGVRASGPQTISPEVDIRGYTQLLLQPC